MKFGEIKYGTGKYGDSWITPIIDRTLSDVAYAKLNRDNVDYNKGALSPEADLHRIESDTRYLADKLNEYGYSVSITTKLNWTESDFPTLADINRTRSNIDVLLDAYHTMLGSPSILYHNYLDYIDMNTIEQNLLNIKTLLDNMAASFWHCGEIYGGEQ